MGTELSLTVTGGCFTPFERHAPQCRYDHEMWRNGGELARGQTEDNMEIPTTGVHHITLIGSNRQDTIDFYQGVLGMPLVFEQPNLDVPEEVHLYFDPGDGCLITFFVRERRETDPTPVPEVVGTVHHIAYAVSRETFDRAAARLEEIGYPNTGRVDRGFMDSLYFRDPNGFLIELAVYTFEPPAGVSRRAIFEEAYKLRVEQGDYAIAQQHLQAAIARHQSGSNS
jgi:catechol 2,3-dioxygenase-like lactoylglutathione lyase family enzyme